MPWDRLTLANWPSAIFRGQAHFLFDASAICNILGDVQNLENHFGENFLSQFRQELVKTNTLSKNSF